MVSTKQRLIVSILGGAAVFAAPMAVAQQAKPAATPAAAAPQPTTTPSPSAVPAQPQPKVLTPGSSDLKPIPAPQLDAQGNPIINPSLDPTHGIKSSDPALSPLEFDSMAHDFGDIDDTKTVSHVFKFRNKTDKTVTILSAHGSCGCTVPDLAKKTYQPSETGEMTVTFNPQNRRGPQPKAVTITYTEPAGTPNTVVTITSNVRPLLVVEPMKMFLNEVDNKAGKAVEVLVSGRKEGFEVTKAASASSNLEVAVGQKREVDIDGQKFTQIPLSVTIKPGTPIGTFTGEVTIETNDERVAVHKYPLTAEVVGDLRATPNRLAIRAFVPHQTFNNIATIESRSGKPFKVTGVEVTGRDDMNLVADIAPANLGPGKTGYTVTVNGVTPDAAGILQGEVIVHTDLADEAVLKVPFTGSVRSTQQLKAAQTAPVAH
jgi:hypothetical protein